LLALSASKVDASQLRYGTVSPSTKYFFLRQHVDIIAI
jgi:hypothetical protein